MAASARGQTSPSPGCSCRRRPRHPAPWPPRRVPEAPRPWPRSTPAPSGEHPARRAESRGLLPDAWRASSSPIRSSPRPRSAAPLEPRAHRDRHVWWDLPPGLPSLSLGQHARQLEQAQVEGLSVGHDLAKRRGDNFALLYADQEAMFAPGEAVHGRRAQARGQEAV